MKRGDDNLSFLLKYENVAWYEDGVVKILDRRIYPIRTEFVTCHTYEEVADAIRDMVTQSGGPFTAAAMGMVLAVHQFQKKGNTNFLTELEKAAYSLSHARPTTSAAMVAITQGAYREAEHLFNQGASLGEIEEALFQYAFHYIDQKYRRYDKTGKYLAELIPDGGTVMTICFGETVIGTALRACLETGKEIRMVCAETRPYFQGARLTASVACDMGVPVTVISDNMVAWTMKEKNIDLFTSAADVITMDGYIVNKIGTFQMAVLGDYLKVPYYVTGEPDQKHPSIDSIQIEQKDPNLVMESMGVKLTMDGVQGYYPAFDITPPSLCHGVVTDKGVLSPHLLKKYFL